MCFVGNPLKSLFQSITLLTITILCLARSRLDDAVSLVTTWHMSRLQGPARRAAALLPAYCLDIPCVAHFLDGFETCMCVLTQNQGFQNKASFTIGMTRDLIPVATEKTRFFFPIRASIANFKLYHNHT
jgi:hypothetical protein